MEEITGKGIRAVIADGEVLCGNRKLMAQFGVDVSAYDPNAFGTEVLTALNGVFIGHIVIADTIKEESPAAIQELKKLGIKTAMLTGDGEASAAAVAAATGIDEVHAKLMPQDKLNELIEIRNRNGAVMFVGDGINDAPVLAGADVGAAMGSGADAAIEAADVVFMNSSLTGVADSISIARGGHQGGAAERGVRPDHQGHGHGAGPSGHGEHVVCRVRGLRRGGPVRGQLRPCPVPVQETRREG